MRTLRRLALLLAACLLIAGQPLVALAADTLVAAEAFLDNPTLAPGAGTPLGLDGDSTNAFRVAAGALDITGVEPGSHTLYLRFQDATGDWSAPVGQTLYVTPGALLAGQNRIEAAEAFIDTDPGEGNGVPLNTAADGSIDSTMEVLRGVMDSHGLGIGVHVLHIRYKDSTGIWSPTNKQSFYVPAVISGAGTGSASSLVSAVGWIDDGPAIALAADDGAFDDLVETVTLSKPVSDAYHSATIRFLDSQGLWSTGESSVASFAGVAGLSGQVTDAATRLPVAGVQVWVGGGYGGLSDSNGFYSVGPLPYGSASVATAKSGYSLYSTTVNFSGPTRLDIALNRDFSACPATGTLSGVVKDGAANKALPGVTVNLGALSKTTNVSGAYSFTGVPAGVQAVAVSKAGYLGYNQPVSMCGNTVQNIPLTKAATTVDMSYGSGWSRDPVNTATGNYTFQRSDLKLPGMGFGFAFERAYNSQGPDGQGPQDGPLGFGWTHNYNTRLEDNGDVTIHWGDGSIQTFASDGAGGYTSQPGVFDSLTHEADGSWTLEKKNGVRYRFDTSRLLQSISDRNGNTQTLTYTGGLLSRVTDTAGRAIVFTYDTNGRITQIQDPLPRTVQFTYDAAGNLIISTDPRGGVTSYTYDTGHQMLTATDPRNHVFVENVYDAAKRVVTTQRDAKGAQTHYAYDVANRKTTITDPFDNVTIHYHDKNMRLTKEEDAFGHSAVYAYDDAGNRTHVMDKNGNVTEYGYDERGNVTSKIDALGNLTTITYDDLNNPLSRTDALGNTTQFEYDANGNLTKTTDALGNIATITYWPKGLPKTITDARLHTTTNTYDAQGNLVEVKNHLNKKTTHTYDAAGRRLSTTDARLHTTNYTYDGNDNVGTVTDPNADVITSTYDGNNNRISVRDKKNNLTEFTYDVKDLLTITKDPSPFLFTTESGYDPLDRRISFKDKRGNTTQYEYDAVGNLTKVTDALLNETLFTYDANGNRLSATDPLGHTTEYGYDPLNRRISTKDPLDQTTLKVYDEVGRVIAVTNAKLQTTGFVYDELGRLMEVHDAEGGIVIYGYDENGNRISMRDPNGNTTQYEYDELDRLKKKTEPEGNITQYQYDEVGNLSQLTKPNGTVIQYGYDELDRLETITYPDSSTVTFSYDKNGNRTGMVDGLGTHTYGYDVLNRMTSHQDPYGNTVGYGYDFNGNRTILTYPGNKTVSYTFDKLNRMTDVTDWLSNNTHYDYDVASRLTKTTNPNGTIANYGYDIADRLTSLSNRKSDNSIISSYAYTLDEIGNHLSEVRTEPLSPVIPSEVVNDTYDKENRLIASNGVANSFDSNGNMIAKGAHTYTYDAADRLIGTEIGETVTQYQYDGLGNRYVRIHNGVQKRFVLDTNTALTNVLVETDAAGNIRAYNVYGQGLTTRVKTDGNLVYYHFDSRGNTIALTNGVQATTDQYAYDPFGRVSNRTGSTDSPFAFLGKHGVLDEGGDLNYIRARYYNTEQQRFISKDAKPGEDQLSQTHNKYVYAANNPVQWIDVSGYSASEVAKTVWNSQSATNATSITSALLVNGSFDSGAMLGRLVSYLSSANPDRIDGDALSASVAYTPVSNNSFSSEFWRILPIQILLAACDVLTPTGICSAIDLPFSIDEGVKNWAPALRDGIDQSKGKEPKTDYGQYMRARRCDELPGSEYESCIFEGTE